MAKVGEGDSRWIVEHREDGHNVNNWHWSEKNVTKWASSRVKKLLAEVSVADGPNSVGVDTITKVEGDATLYNRKGVLKSLFDLNINGKWTGKAKLDDAYTNGEFKLEVFDDDPEIFITMDASSACNPEVRRLMETKAKKLMLEKVVIFVGELREGAGFDLGDIVKKASTKETSTSFVNSSSDAPTSQATGKSGTKLEIEDFFRTTPAELYLAFLDPKRVSAYTGQPAEISATENGSFSLMNGTVTGTNTSLKSGASISQRWRMAKWPSGVHSTVNIRLEDADGHSKMFLQQTGIPEQYRAELEDFWRRAILERMKVVLGYGAARFF